jgi:hypothetical protein
MAKREYALNRDRHPSGSGWRHFWRYWVQPLLPLPQMARSIRGYAAYLSDWSSYQKLPGAEPISFAESYPCLFDVAKETPFDAHYFCQAIWAAERIVKSPSTIHVDVGSDTRFVGLLAVQKAVLFVDLRLLRATYSRLNCLCGDLRALPFVSGSIRSLSCLHVVEHIGLGRYGDQLDPLGSRKACIELSRVLATGGELYLSLPVGREQVSFNAHRVHSPEHVLAILPELHLIGFSAVADDGTYQVDASLNALAHAEYACGLFHFKK